MSVGEMKEEILNIYNLLVSLGSPRGGGVKEFPNSQNLDVGIFDRIRLDLKMLETMKKILQM